MLEWRPTVTAIDSADGEKGAYNPVYEAVCHCRRGEGVADVGRAGIATKVLFNTDNQPSPSGDSHDMSFNATNLRTRSQNYYASDEVLYQKLTRALLVHLERLSS